MGTLKCCVGGCIATSATHRLFSVPKNDSLRNLWMSFLVPTNPFLATFVKEQLIRKRVCEKHFDKQQFSENGERLRFSYPALFTEEEIRRGEPLPPANSVWNVFKEHNYYLKTKEEQDEEFDDDVSDPLAELQPGYTVEEIEIPVPWGHVAGRWWGPRNKQPIIAIHGWQDNAGTWDNLIPLLPVTTSVLCIDLPGHGLSTYYPKGMIYYIFWDGIVLVRRIVKHFKWSNVTLMGHSLGGAISFMYAASYPDEVNRIICVDIASPAVREPSNMVKVTGGSIDKMLEYEHLTEDKVPCYDYDEMIDIVCDAYKGSLSRENCQVLMKRGMSRTPAHMKKQGYYFKRDPRLKVSGLGMMSIETALEYASKVRCKVLNLRALPGQRWEKIEYYLSVIDKLKRVTDVQYIEVEGTHHVHLENPENIVQYIEDFIEELF